jgi:hypothetical protein
MMTYYKNVRQRGLEADKAHRDWQKETGKWGGSAWRKEPGEPDTLAEWARKHGVSSSDLPVVTLNKEDAMEFAKKQVDSEADYLFKRFIYQIEEKTGDIENVDLFMGSKGLEGYVYGKNGSVKVESILAGGYNIQRLHMRVIVKDYTKGNKK